MPHRMTMRVRNYNWQCCNCKCCMKCKVNRDHNKMLFCEQCDRGFHIYCLGIKTVPDGEFSAPTNIWIIRPSDMYMFWFITGRWSCNRCSICVRCGSSKPEGWFHSQQQLINAVNGENVKQARHKKVKWVNEYRVDHLTKVKEHISMLCVPCARMKPTRRVQIATCNNTTLNDFNSNSYNCTQSAISLRTENITTSTSSEDTCFSENKESGSHLSNNKKFQTSTTATTSATNQTATAGSPPAVAWVQVIQFCPKQQLQQLPFSNLPNL